MSDEFWVLLENAISNGESIDNIIPRDLIGLNESDYIKILAVYMVYGDDPERRKICKKKWIDHESRGNSI